MNLPAFSVRRPVVTTMVTLIVLVLGAFSFNRIQIDLFPNIELPTLSIRTSYEGASPEVIETQVTQVVEDIVSTVPGVEELTSESSEGSSQVRVRFGWGTDIDTAALDVQSRLQDELNELPEGVERPWIRKFDIASFPIVMLGISSNLHPVELTELIEDQIRYRLARIPGVAQVDTFGGYHREVRIELDPDRIRALGLPMDRVLQALRDANLDLPSGEIESGRYQVALRAPAQFSSIEQIRHTVIETGARGFVTVGQIAEVRDTFERLRRIYRINGERGVRVGIRKQADANTVEVSRGILQEVEAINQDFPQLRILPVSNQGNFIERSIANVARSVVYGGGLAVLVLLFFLRNVRSTVIISLAIPISIVATFALIYFGGFTINLMTLGGLALGVGMMVDSSIVVLENTFRRRDEHRDPPPKAAAEGAREVASAIVASTLTTVVIFLPLVFVRGVAGLLFRDMAYVIVFALICSLLVSLSLVPMLSSKLLKDRGRIRQRRAGWVNRLAHRSENAFQRLDGMYRDLLATVLRHRAATLGLALLLLGGSLLLVPVIGTEFTPPSDEGEVSVSGEMEVGSRLDLVDEQTRLIEARVKPVVPEARVLVASVNDARGEVQLSLTPAKERDRSNVEIAADLRQRLSGQIPGMEVRTRAHQGQFLLDRLVGGGDGLSVEVRGRELDRLRALGERVAETIADVPGITDVRASFDEGLPQQEIHVDRQKAADLGLSVRDVAEVLRTAMAGSRAGEFRTAGDSYRILVKLQEAEKLSLDEVLNLTLTTPSGEAVALRNLVTTRGSRAPLEIERKDQQRQVSVQANMAGRDLGSVAAEVQERIDRIPLPTGYSIELAGSFAEQREAFKELLISAILAVVLVYMVLACQYESLRDPLVVMFSVPMAAVGVLVTLFLTGTTLNLQSAIGCIMLAGIVVNNAILLVDQAGRLCREGVPVDQAVAEAGRRRLRPILMTTSTTILGLLPLALGIGEGADAQAPLARAVVGGLTGSTVITLIVTPVIFSVFHPQGRRVPEGWQGALALEP